MVYVEQIALEHLEGRREGSAFFFFNLIEVIGSVIKKLLHSSGVQEMRVITSRRTVEEPFAIDLISFGIKETKGQN
jgi:hypothetical protein